MKVSIIIPAYNEERFIGRTLTAVLAQDYSDMEVIVVDNNSKDGTAAAVRAFPNVRLVTELRQGVQFARERGRQEASGDIIANLDGDCLPRSDWASKATAYFKDANVVAVSGPYEFYDASFLFRILWAFGQRVLLTSVSWLLYTFFGRGAIAMGGNMFMRATALASIGGYNTKIVFYGDDIDTINRMATVGKVMYRNSIAVPSSARRFQRQGVMKVQLRYILNYIWVVLFHRPFSNVSGG